MKTTRLLAQFFALPFIIAAAFRYTDWLGWPTLIVGGIVWLGTCVQIGKIEQ